jgi:CRP-like cAMP-binding protein
MASNDQTSWPRPCFTTATANFLGHLAPAVRSQLEPALETVSVCRDSDLFDCTTESGRYLYFPQGPLISLEQGSQIEVGLVGSEGLVGWPSLAGFTTSPYRAVVRGRDGNVLRIRTEALLATARVFPVLRANLARFVTVIGVQMAETICAHATHRIDVRLARWLLLRHDRVGGDELIVQHDEIATNLGARRASITDGLHIIEGTGIVRCRRGKIVIRNRIALQALAGGCYGSAESLYREIIGSFGKTVEPTAGLSELADAANAH